MKVLFVHNEYAKPSGEEHASRALAGLLRQHEHEVIWYLRSSADVGSSIRQKIGAFCEGLHSSSAIRSVRTLVSQFRPDVAQVQNVYPLISPSVFPTLSRLRVPVVMRCPNYRLFCPNGLHLCHGEVCDRCLRGIRELNCIRHNCLEDPGKSFAYAVRNWFARVRRCMLDNVDMFIVQSQFQKSVFAANGISANHLGVVPGLLPTIPEKSPELGETVSFVGRISPEKGIHEFLDAARRLPSIPFAVAGDYSDYPRLAVDGPANVSWRGFLGKTELQKFFEQSRVLVFPSRWYEGFPNVATQAMAEGKPIIASRIGVFPEIVNDGVTGVLCDVRDNAGLATCIETLYRDPETCRRMGDAGRAKAQAHYGHVAIYEQLMDVYARAAHNAQER